MKKLIILLFFIGLVLQGFAQMREVPFTLDDRDRIMRTEAKVEAIQLEMNVKIESLRKEMNSKFEALDYKFEAIDSKFDAIESKIDRLFSGFIILISIMLFILGFIIWDRRTALDPVRKKIVTHEERLEKLEKISREHAKKDPVFAEMLKVAGLLWFYSYLHKKIMIY